MAAKSKRPRIALFGNHKGGCGKTTGAFHLAWLLHDLGLRVLVIDTDQQGNLYRRFRKATDYKPSEFMPFDWAEGCTCVVASEIVRPDGFDVVVVDAPPSHALPGGVQPDVLVVPIDCIDAALGATDIIDKALDGDVGPLVLVVKNGTDEGGRAMKQKLDDIQGADGVEICPTDIPRGAAIKRTDKTCEPAWCDRYKSEDAKRIKEAYGWVAERVQK